MDPAHRRRLKTLARLWKAANRRHDTVLLLPSIAPGITYRANRGINKFSDTHKQIDCCDLAYDLSRLEEDELIKFDYAECRPLGQDEAGQPQYEYEGEGVRVTKGGAKTVAEFEKWWVTKAIDKQPFTFAAVLLSLISVIAGWVLSDVRDWYFSTNTDSEKQFEPQNGSDEDANEVDSTATTFTRLDDEEPPHPE